ncbi:MAG: hypothetical protein IPL61_07075 [Myxococcales bacterium]|nr:hypothetical protein [Myxococcales bacterium]
MTHVARFAVFVLLVVVAACGSVGTEPDAGGAIDAPAPTDAPIDGTPTATLQVALGGNGTGTVTSAPAGINCGADCTEAYPIGTTVVLTAVASGGGAFVSWSGGGCSGTDTCTVTLTADTNVTANFALNNSLVVALAGTGSGVVTSTPAGINCGADCAEAYPPATVVALTAVPAAGSTFTGWGGACAGTGACMVSVTAPTAVTATFTLNQYTLTVTRAGTGTGTVTSTPAGITCGADCSELYDHGTSVTLTATPAVGSTFTGWSGACAGVGTCAVAVTAATSVTATFALNQYTLTVSRGGNGTGTVTSAPAGITCGGDCTEIYNHGTTVVLTATPATGSTFTGWSGACTGIGTCSIAMTAAATATATFTLNTYTLTVARAGMGSGTVTSSPAGITCGADCTEVYAYGTSVVLTATPATGSTFTGWSGACAGTGPCNLTITAAATATATFSAGCVTQTVDILGAQHVTLNYASTQAWRDDYFRAYEDTGYDLTGWVGFDLSSIPDTATISAMTLYAYAFTVVNAPTVRVQYSAANSWSSATVTTAQLVRTNAQVANAIAPTVNAWNAFPIIITSQNWAADLADNWLSLGVDNTNAMYSYAYFRGVTNVERPYVRITYCN